MAGAYDDRDGFIWMDGALVPWRDAKVHVLTHALHYASSVFEGERCYNGKIFKGVEHSERLVRTLRGPKQMVVYQESRHSVGNVATANLGPFPPILVADWLADRIAGKPFASEHWFVRSNGQIDKVPY